MTILLPTLAAAFAAFCVWLAVRIVNRQERWAKWTLGMVVGLPVLYVAGFGPACWLCEHGILGQNAAWAAFRPMTWLACNGQPLVADGIRSYAVFWGDKRRIRSFMERGESWTFAWAEREVRLADSVSPIDFEVELSDQQAHEERLQAEREYWAKKALNRSRRHLTE